MLNFCVNAGTVWGGLGNPKLTFSDNVKLRAGNNKLSLLSVAVGLPVSSLFSDICVFCNILNLLKSNICKC